MSSCGNVQASVASEAPSITQNLHINGETLNEIGKVLNEIEDIVMGPRPMSTEQKEPVIDSIRTEVLSQQKQAEMIRQRLYMLRTAISG